MVSIIFLSLFTAFGFYISDDILEILILPISDIINDSSTKLIINKFTTIILNKIYVGLFFGFIITMPVLLYEFFMFLFPAFQKKIILFKIILLIIISFSFFLLGIFFSIISRKNEFSADAYSAQTAELPESLISGLKKMSKENLSNLTPHWLNVFLNYSHPPVLSRVKALKTYIKA